MITHSVIFNLKAAPWSIQEADFFTAAHKLGSLPGVRNFRALKQTNTKNTFTYGLSMEFDTLEDYQNYNSHPKHQHFIEAYWISQVADFLEIDFEPIKN